MPAVKERYPYLLRAVSLTVCIAFFSGIPAAASPRPETVYKRERPLSLQPPLNTWAPSDTIRLEYALSSLLTAIKKPVDEIDMRIPVILEENGEKKRIAVANLRKTRIRVENGLWVVPCAMVPGENFEALFTPDKRFVRLRKKGSSAKTDINALAEDILMLPDNIGPLSVEAYTEAEDLVRRGLQVFFPEVPYRFLPPEDGEDSGTRVIGRYRVLGYIGEGYSGSVYMAVDGEGNNAALKVFSPTSLTGRIMLLQEYLLTRMAGGADNMVSLRGAGYYSERGKTFFFMAMEKAEGMTLEEEIITRAGRGEDFTYGEIRDTARQLLQSVRELRKRHIIHSDIKPKNIIRDERGNNTIIDLGLALYAPGGTFTFSIPTYNGTVEYLPDSALLSHVYDSKTDVFAVGCVLFEMLRKHNICNIEAWRPELTAGSMYVHRSEVDARKKEIEDLVASDDPLEKFIGRLMSEKPHGFVSAEEALEALEELPPPKRSPALMLRYMLKRGISGDTPAKVSETAGNLKGLVPGRTGSREQTDDLRLPDEISAPFSDKAEEWVREYFPELRDYLLRLLLVIQKLDRRMEELSAEDCAAMASDLESRIPVKRIKKEVLAGGASEDLFLPIEQPVNLISQGVGLVLWRIRRCRERGTEMSGEKLQKTRNDISGAKENTSKLLEIFRRIWADGQEEPVEAERSAREGDAPRNSAMRYYYFKEPLSADTRACVAEFFPELETYLLKLIRDAGRLSRDLNMTVETHYAIEQELKRDDTFDDIWRTLRFKENSGPGSMERIEDAVLNMAQGIQLISSRLRLRKERGTFTVDARVRKMIEDLQRAGDEAEGILSDLLMVLVEGEATPGAEGHVFPAEPPLHEVDDLVGYIEYMYHFVERISAFGRDSSVWVRDAGSGEAYRLRLESWIRHRISNIFMILEYSADPSVLDFAKLSESLPRIRQSGFAGILSSSEYGFGELAGQLSGELKWAGTEEDPLPYSAAILMYFLKRHFVEADNGSEKWDRFRKYARRFDHAVDRLDAAVRSFTVSRAREETENLYFRHDLDTLSDLLEPGADGFPMCFLEEVIGLSLNHKVVLVFDERLGRGKAGGPLNSFLEAVARFRSDKRYAGVMKDLIVVSSDVEDVPDILSEHEDAVGTKVFTFAVESERSRSMLDPARERTDTRMVFIEENGIPDNAYYPLMEIVTMSLAEAFVRPDTISYDLKGLNIASVHREGGAVIFTLLPEAEEMSYGTLIKRYALFKRVLRAA